MNVTLTAGTAGQRADQFLAAALDGLTRSAAQKLLEEGRVLRGGKALKKNDRLQPGDVLTLCIPDPSPVEILPQEIPLDVVYEDGDVIVVNKPVGLVVHPAPGHPDGTLVNALLYHCGQSLSGINGRSGRGSSTGLTGTPAASSSPPRTTWPTWPWPSSSRITASTGSTRRWWWATFREDQGTISSPSPATPLTGRRWR